MYDAGQPVPYSPIRLRRCENIHTRHNKIERQDIILFIQYFSFIFTDRLQNQAYHANVFTVRETHSTLSLPRRAVSCPFRSFKNNQLSLYVFNLFCFFSFDSSGCLVLNTCVPECDHTPRFGSGWG